VPAPDHGATPHHSSQVHLGLLAAVAGVLRRDEQGGVVWFAVPVDLYVSTDHTRQEGILGLEFGGTVVEG